MSYKFREIEAKWQEFWAKNETFKANNNSEKPKYYVLDMFPYPSGAGLHVGHPLGYIASDIYARYKRHKGFNVLHPMGFDSFGLPAEQYAIQTGQHPAITTEANIKRYREQLDKLGFSYDWNREVRTSDPSYYKWTQWIFIQLFNSWYNKVSDKAEPIENLIKAFEEKGNSAVDAACDEDTPEFSASEWGQYTDKEKQAILLRYRLTYLADTEVNWCPALGTVLANDEIVNGVSERGGHPVVRKKMTQWIMRITAYAQRLLDGLEKIDWPQPLKDAQTNWIGRSEGASVVFYTKTSEQLTDSHPIEVFTTRPDTIFGASFMTLAPEHELVSKITTKDQQKEVDAYVEYTAKRSERDRLSDVKTITGAFTGAYAVHPFTGDDIPIWIGDYVLAGYGTGAVMSVPCGDQRDYDFAKKFNIPIPNIFEGIDISEEAFADKERTIIANSDFINGMNYKDACRAIIDAFEEKGQGQGKINFRLRDAVFSRQRYWGEPFPAYYVNGMPQMIDAKHLPLLLPEVEKYLPTETGDPPLGNAGVWAWNINSNEVVSNDMIDHKTVFPLELNTMPGWAGSSQYFNRYMDPGNDEAIYSHDAISYWQDVDLYIGGIEHATGHLLYSRFWQKFMFDRGWATKDEYAKKLINQGMILGSSAFIYSYEGTYIEKGSGHTVGTGYGKMLISNDTAEFVAKHLEVFSDLWLKQREATEIYLKRYGIDVNTFKKIDSTYQQFRDEVNKLGLESINWNRYSFPLRKLHVDVSYVGLTDELDLEKFHTDERYEEFQNAVIILDNDRYIVGREVEKMSKSKFNVVNPDEICDEYGADALRLYEMFLGPLEQAKPWNTAGITGVYGFLKKLWKLYHNGNGGEFLVTDEAASKDSLKTLHKTIKKVEEDIEQFSFNTSVSTFMICVNELSAQKCNQKEVLEPLAVILSPYAPHIAEELWAKLGHGTSIAEAGFPEFKSEFLVEQTKVYPISFNGKMRFTLELPLDMNKEEIEEQVMAHERTQQQLQGRTPKKVIVVPGKIVNIVG